MQNFELVAILAAIIHSGADDREGACGYSPDGAVKRAKLILEEAKQQTKASDGTLR